MEDKDYAVSTMTHIAYVAEMALTRKIELNDGHRVVEAATFRNMPQTKLLADVEDLTIDLACSRDVNPC